MSESPQTPTDLAPDFGRLSIEYVPVEDVVRAQVNPKAHDQDMTIRSIRRFGFIDSVVRDGRTGRLIAGHGRLEALQAMHAAGKRQSGEAAPSGIVVDEQGRWLMPVQVGWSSRSDDEAAAALVVLNKATEAGGWNPLELGDLLTQLKGAHDPDLFTLSGFKAGELDKILKDIGGVDPNFEPEDDATRLDESEKDTMECPNCHQTIQIGVRVRGLGRGRRGKLDDADGMQL